MSAENDSEQTKCSATAVALWPTPQTADAKMGPRTGYNKRGNLMLTAAVCEEGALWATPSSYWHQGKRGAPTPEAWDKRQMRVQERIGQRFSDPLEVQVARPENMWPTPQAHDAAAGDPARVGRYGTKHGGRNLTDEVHLWPTPSACNANDGKAPVECAPAPSTSSSAGLLASRLRRLVSALVTGTADGSGARHCASLETSDPGGPYWRTPQGCLAFDTATGSRPLDEYSSSYPRWGTVAAGESGLPLMSALRIDATACSSSQGEPTWATPASSWTEGRGTTRPETWVTRQQARVDQGKQPFADPLHVQVARQAWPTPTVPNGGRSPKGGMTPTGMTQEGIKRQVDLGHHVRMAEQEQWPTPRAADAERTTDAGYSPERGQSLTGRLRPIKTGQGQLNPAFVESLMGFPKGWLEEVPSAQPTPRPARKVRKRRR